VLPDQLVLSIRQPWDLEQQNSFFASLSGRRASSAKRIMCGLVGLTEEFVVRPPNLGAARLACINLRLAAGAPKGSGARMDPSLRSMDTCTELLKEFIHGLG
jgi:hypothetical protein